MAPPIAGPRSDRRWGVRSSIEMCRNASFICIDAQGLPAHPAPFGAAMTEFDWDDLRYVLKVAAEGSLAAAARKLHVNHTTVLRRVDAFEKRLGMRVFERLPSGYVLTAGGEDLIAAASRIDDEVVALERKLTGRDLQLTGTVRVTTTDSLAVSLLPEILAAFRRAHPGILIELAVSNAMFNLTRRDADIAIRPALKPPEAMIGRRVSAIAFAIYASPDYLAGRQLSFDDLKQSAWIVPDESLADSSVWRWMRATLPDVEVALEVDSLLTARHLAAAGAGLAALPCYLGDSALQLVRVTAPIDEMATELWLLTHPDLRRTARVRAFTEFVAEALGRRKVLLEGRES
jgi:DNA-binding transcriptional LysR family regulator